MRTTIDIPDETYLKLKLTAASERTSVKALILRSVDKELAPKLLPAGNRRRLSGPIVTGGVPGSIKLVSSEMLDELLLS